MTLTAVTQTGVTLDAGEGVAGFVDLALRPELLDVISELGYEEPTPIQRAAIPPLLQGHDLVGQAATGTGKTAAFALPVLQRMPEGAERAGPVALVLVPTRELAMQVSRAFHRYGRRLGTRVLAVYGGQPIGRQLAALERGVDVVVATPGRALDHIARGTLHLSGLATVVLDEADEMLDMGFAEDIEAILSQTPAERQTALFSATIPPRIDAMAHQYLRDPIRVRLGGDGPLPDHVPLVRQRAYVVPRGHKAAALGRVLDVEAPAAALVFCRTREDVDQLTEELNGRGYRAEALHGGMGQDQRDRVMGRLRSGTADLIVATDVAARGLDIEQLTHVVNYDVPSAPDAYVHRIGRVGRAGREGVAITLAEPREHRMLKIIERVTRQRVSVEKVPSVADLQARRLERTRAALRERLLAGADPERYRPAVGSLVDEFGAMEVALAAVELAHESRGTTADEQEIPDVVPRPARGAPGRGLRVGGGSAQPATGSADPGTGSAARGADRRRPGRCQGAAAGAMTRLFVGVGRRAGIRPQDLVGAIAGETGLSGHQIGAIEIADRFSLVEVPESAVAEVMAALRASTIKGKKAPVRRERDEVRRPRTRR